MIRIMITTIIVFFTFITSLTKFAQVEVNSFDIELSGSSKLSCSSDDQSGIDGHDAFYKCPWLFCILSIRGEVKYYFADFVRKGGAQWAKLGGQAM